MRRYALCIGNNNYTALSKLSAARADAEAIAAELVSLGFDVDTGYDLQSREMAGKIGILEKKMMEYDAVLFYFAGHGFEIDGINILAPIELNPDDERALILHDAYKVSELMELLEKADDKVTPKAKIIILDACRTQLNLRGSSPDFAPIYAPQGSIIAFSTSPGQTAKERDGHGVYTATLLRYMNDPRISIERVFKRVRTSLVNETNGNQIPWEHTSLIGDFYLNPNTIYDGISYSQEAFSDADYIFKRNSVLKDIVHGLKSHNYYQQQDALRDFKRIKQDVIDDVSPDDLFILGRNIYQAACGGCWDCQNFLDDFGSFSFLSNAAKLHILNGMAFEIYFNSEGMLRRNAKGKYFEKVIDLLEREEYYGSQRFIASLLEKEKRVFYIPGQDDKVEISVKLSPADKQVAEEVNKENDVASNVLVVEDVLYDRKSIYYSPFDDEKAEIDDFFDVYNIKQFENYVREKLLVAKGYLLVHYQNEEVDNKTVLLLPCYGFELYPREE